MVKYCDCGNEIEHLEDDVCEECFERIESYEEEIKPLDFKNEE